MILVVQSQGVFGVVYGTGAFVGWIEVTLIEFVGHAVLLDAELWLELSESPPLTTTQAPMAGYDEGKFWRA
jgi:hypothetical protein